jgi:hypothetical protein
MGAARMAFAVALLAAVSACARLDPVPPEEPAPGLAGPMRAVETTGRTGQRVLGLTQGRLRACSGAYDPPTLASPWRTTDLACTGGVRGEATVGPDLLGGRSVQWVLETGESGRTRL